MTGTITLSDGGQNYIEIELACGVIQEVRPAMSAGWKGTKVLNSAFFIGDRLIIGLQWKDYQFALPYPIVDVKYEELYGSEWLLENMSRERKLYTNPVTYIDHMAYVVDCKGLPFYFDCVNYAAIAAAEALLMVDKIPDVLLEDVEGVQLVEEINPGSPETIAAILHSMMTIFDNNIVDYGIITHEATHAWAFDKWGQYDPPENTDYKAAIRSDEPPVTKYAETSPAEDLAEAVRYYIYSPEFLKAKCPRRYDIIEMMMKYPMYHG